MQTMVLVIWGFTFWPGSLLGLLAILNFIADMPPGERSREILLDSRRIFKIWLVLAAVSTVAGTINNGLFSERALPVALFVAAPAMTVAALAMLAKNAAWARRLREKKEKK
ncbi:hypothetical protein JW899_01350 [Candidatus Uhrbacteria bacterium]|nr:hypothetical protein [Candidatus Uhrbacteria bacterium]